MQITIFSYRARDPERYPGERHIEDRSAVHRSFIYSPGCVRRTVNLHEWQWLH